MWAAVLLLIAPAASAAGAGDPAIVVQAADGSPLPGAEVFHLDENGLAELFRAPIGALEVYLERHAVLRVADAQGRVEVPDPPAGLYYGRSGARRGAYRLSASEMPRPLVLAPVPHVRVEVTDAAGAPVADESVTFRGYEGALATYWCGVGTTGADGTLTFPLFFPLRGLGATQPLPPFDRSTVRLDLIGALREVELDKKSPAAAPIVLERPPVRTLELVPAARGKALPEEAFPVSVRRPESGTRPDYGTVVALDSGPVRLRVAAGTELVIAPLATPLRKRGDAIAVRVPEEDRVAQVVVERGPPALEPGDVLVAARLFTRAGDEAAVFAGAKGRLFWLPDAGDVAETPIHADANGRFHARIRVPDVAQAGVLACLVERDDGDAYEALVRRDPLRGGIVDLADVVLERSPVLAEGRVLLPDGSPAAGATVAASVREASLEPSRPARHRVLLRLTADEAGRFALLGRDRAGFAGAGAFRAILPGYGRTPWIAPVAPDPEREPSAADATWRRIAVGAGGNAELRLDEPAFLTGQLALAAGVDATRLRVAAVYAGEDEALDPLNAARPEPDGDFVVGPLGRRACDLVVFLDGDGHAPAPTTDALRMSGLVPAPAADAAEARAAGATDSRIAPWDLRDELFECALRVHDPRGRPVPSVRIAFLEPGAATGEGRVRDATTGDDVLRVRGFARPLSVRLSAPGFRTAVVELDEAQEVVALVSAISVTLAIQDPPALGEGGFLRARLTGGDPPATVEFDLDAQGLGRVDLPCAGRYTLDLRACRVRDGVPILGARSDELLPARPAAVLDVPESGARRYEVALDPELREALLRSVEPGEGR